MSFNSNTSKAVVIGMNNKFKKSGNLVCGMPSMFKDKDPKRKERLLRGK